MRLLFALRFRDLDLLISDQVTGRQPAPLPSLAVGPAAADRAVPALRQGPVPRRRRRRPAGLHPGRLHDVRPVPERAGVRPGRARGRPALGAARLQLHPQQREDHRRRLRRDDALLRRRPDRPDHPRLPGRLPDALHADRRRCPPTCGATCASRRSCSTSRPRVFGRYHVTDPQQFFRSDDLWTVPTGQAQRADASRPRPTTSSCGCPGESDAEFLLLQPMVPTNRPNMIAWVAARNDAPNYGTTRVYRFPADTTVFGPAQIEARIDQDPIISQQVSLVEPVRQQGHPRQPDRRAARRLAHLPPAGLPAVDQRRRSRSSSGSSSPRRTTSSGGRRSARRSTCCSARGEGGPTSAVADARPVADARAPRRRRRRRPGRPTPGPDRAAADRRRRA